MEQAWTVTSGQPSTAWSDDSSGRDMIPQADPVIVADNQLPAEYGREFTEIDFSYENPTVARVAHPGPAQVKTLSKDSEGTCSPAPTPGSTTSEATSTSLARVLGEALVAPCLLGVDAVAFSAGQFAYRHLVGLGSAFDAA